MKKQITSFSPVQTAKIFAALSFVSSLPFMALMLIPMMAMPGAKPPFFMGFVLFMPVFYAIFSFIFIAVGAWLYNLLAKHVGGIEFTSVEVANDV